MVKGITVKMTTGDTVDGYLDPPDDDDGEEADPSTVIEPLYAEYASEPMQSLPDMEQGDDPSTSAKSENEGDPKSETKSLFENIRARLNGTTSSNSGSMQADEPSGNKKDANPKNVIKRSTPRNLVLEAIVTKLKATDAESGTMCGMITLPAAHYQSLKSLCDVVTRMINENIVNTNIQIKFVIENGRVRFYSETGGIGLFCTTPYLAQHLGITPNEMTVGGSKLYYILDMVMGTRRAFLDDIHQIFVYSDIIDYQIVGNTKAMLLGVFPSKGTHAEQHSWQFNPLQYIKVTKSVLQSIHIKLCSATGEPVPFVSGDTLCRLHFRRKLV